MTNLLIAIKNMIEKPVNKMIAYYKETNRANNIGDAPEKYVKDAFCGIVNNTSDVERKNKQIG